MSSLRFISLRSHPIFELALKKVGMKVCAKFQISRLSTFLGNRVRKFWNTYIHTHALKKYLVHMNKASLSELRSEERRASRFARSALMNINYWLSKSIVDHLWTLTSSMSGGCCQKYWEHFFFPFSWLSKLIISNLTHRSLAYRVHIAVTANQ